jgi:hypothetical protein
MPSGPYSASDLKSIGPGDNVRDYRHAARIFGSNDFIRAPRSKYLFYVVITTNPAATSDNFGTPPDFKSEMSYMVKNIELPKFEIEVQEHNQYNRKVLAQRQIKYNPITIKFHDDQAATVRDFWQAYYNYYYMDGRFSYDDFKKYDKYKSRTSGTSNRWGLDTNAKQPYIHKIDIYSLYHGTGNKITLESPMITSFNHDSHDYADNTGLMEASMTVRYTGVRYEQQNPIDAANGIPGFGQAAPEAYDTEFSSLVTGTGQDIINSEGNYATSVDQGPVTNYNLLYFLQNRNFNRYNPILPSYITTNQLSAVLNANTRTPVNANYVFPSSNSLPTTFQDYGALPLQGTVASSDGKQIQTPSQVDSLYVKGSWQQTLFEKGYTSDQINAANNYIKSQGTGAFGAGIPGQPAPNYVKIAQSYLGNPTSPSLANFGTPVFGQPATNNSSINFSNPITSTQSVYNGQDWKYKLSQSGYTPSDISSAERFLLQLKISPGADLASVASNYINKSKKTGLVGVTASVTKTNSTSTNTLTGPNFNPADETGMVYKADPNAPTTNGTINKYAYL